MYLSIDIDSIDPAFAPGTGTPETGGWSTREIRTIIRGLEGINLAAADIVEVAPAYDTNAELTTVRCAISRCLFCRKLTHHPFPDGCRRRPLRGHDSYGQVWPDVSSWAEIRRSEGGSLERAKRH